MIERKLYDANLRMLEVELELAGFPDDVTWDLRREMPWSWPAFFSLEYETLAYGFALKGVLYFEHMLVTDTYRFISFDVEFVAETEAIVLKYSFRRRTGYSVGLREAINLMHGRPVYRDYRHDPLRKGYWLELKRKTDDGEYTLVRNRIDFMTMTALERGFFGKRLGSGGCMKLADQLDGGDKARVEIGAKTIFVEVDLARERLALTNTAGKQAKLNWWELFVKRK